MNNIVKWYFDIKISFIVFIQVIATSVMWFLTVEKLYWQWLKSDEGETGVPRINFFSRNRNFLKGLPTSSK